MSRFQKADLSEITLNSISARQSKVAAGNWGKVFDHRGTFAEFIKSLPDVLAARDLRKFSGLAGDAVRNKRLRVLMMGAHVVKVGLAPIVCDMLERRILSVVAMNSA